MFRSMLRAVLALLLRLVFRPRISGLGNIPDSGPCIIAANHLSFCDHVLISLMAKRPVWFIGKAERLDGTGLRDRLRVKLLHVLGFVPVKRDGGAGGVDALKRAEEVLREGRIFGIHPEGTRSPDGRVYRGRAGVGWLALATGAPVVPCGLAGTDRVQPLGRLMWRVTRFDMHFGSPMTFPEFAGREGDYKVRRLVTDSVMEQVHTLAGLEYVHRYAPRSTPGAEATAGG
ncbi:1-acyl-sn-glycerol-3-phosphate acyltransferase [Streptomyces polychromogenes]|nr:1-acyl-sn-glycerol-3-phosphate acyltransferase [Streptomyces polychromogenes]